MRKYFHTFLGAVYYYSNGHNLNPMIPIQNWISALINWSLAANTVNHVGDAAMDVSSLFPSVHLYESSY